MSVNKKAIIQRKSLTAILIIIPVIIAWLVIRVANLVMAHPIKNVMIATQDIEIFPTNVCKIPHVLKVFNMMIN